MRFFNTVGPVRPDKHYCLPPLTRFDLGEILSLIDQEKYFVLHAPRQTGKTTCLLALMEHLNQQGQYRCLYCNFEVGQSAREEVEAGMQAILSEMASRARSFLQDSFPDEIWREVLNQEGEGTALNQVLTRWAEQSPQPLVLLVDEIDSLVGDTLIAVLRQLRAGYDKRPALFPQSMILCGVRDVRDYRIHSDQGKTIITGGSAFNIKAESLRLGNFDRAEVESLYAQHTEETGQVFDSEALDLVWELTRGQPWLVNALGYETCFKMKEGRDRTCPVTAERVQQAKENLILRRETHLDQLADKLREERVRRIIEPLLVGDLVDADVLEDDYLYVRDLGLIAPDGEVRMANPLYAEVIPRALSWGLQRNLTHQTAWYVREDGSLDLPALLRAFQAFYREHSEAWLARFQFQEAGPHLMLMAFLQRVVNAGGTVQREFAIGSGQADVVVRWGKQVFVIELKIRRGDGTEAKGIGQLAKYLERLEVGEGYLVLFDRRKEVGWDEKIYERTVEHEGKRIHVFGA